MAYTMESVFIAITLSDGTLGVMQFLTQGRGTDLPQGATWKEPGIWLRPAIPANVDFEVTKTYAGQVVSPISWRQVTAAALPNDRVFRGAWRDTGSNIIQHLPSSRQLVLDKVRAWRIAKLQDLDAVWMKAFAQGDTAGAVAAEAQRDTLRNLPQTLGPQLQAATTVAEIKTILQNALVSA